MGMEILRKGSDYVLDDPDTVRNCCFPVGTMTFRVH